jgi:hypothetical protein
MANSGSFNTSDYNGRYLTLSWSLTGQNPADNTSTISWSLRGAGSAPETYYNAGNFKVIINDVTVYQSATRIRLYNGTLVASGSLTISHYPDGQKDFNASVEAGIYSVAVNVTGQGSFALPPITRYATLISATDFNDDQNPSCEFNNPTNAKLQFKITVGSADVVVRNNVTNAVSPYTFELTDNERNALRALCADSQTLEVKITIATYSGSTPANWQYLTRQMSIVDALPVASGISYKDNNATVTAITLNNQIIVQNQSTLLVSISSITAKKQASLVSAEVLINGVYSSVSLSGSTASNISISFGQVDVSSDITAKLIIEDSRGFEAVYDINLLVDAWSLPTAIINLQRQDNYYTATDLMVDASYSSVSGKNQISIEYLYKQVTASSWTDGGALTDGQTVTVNLDNTKEWLVKVNLADRFGSTSYTLKVGIGIPLVFFDRFRRSLGVNCLPDQDNSFMSSGLAIDNNIAVGSQELFSAHSMSAQGNDNLLAVEGLEMISGLFEGITIPAGYQRGYRITAQVSTSSSNKASVKLNNIQSNEISTASAQTVRKIVSTAIFVEDDITLETVGSGTGLKLYAVNDASGDAYIYSITLHGYIVKA